MVNVSVELESREYNGRWYTEARAWKMDKTSSGNAEGPPPYTDEPYAAESSNNNTADDLPF